MILESLLFLVLFLGVFVAPYYVFFNLPHVKRQDALEDAALLEKRKSFEKHTSVSDH